MSDGQRYPIGRTLTEFGNQLSKSDEFANPTGEGEWRQINHLAAGLTGSNKEFIEDSKEYLENIRNLVVNNFDFAITTLTLINDFMFLLPNFMSMVMTYLSNLVYNALDAYLRLGMHVLVVPPNFTERAYKGYPTTSLDEQAENVYKKFYDSADPYVPYALPYVKDLDERLIESGKKLQNKIEKYTRVHHDNKGRSLLEQLIPGAKSSLDEMKTDYIDFEKSIQNLSRPLGVYDAIFLYFSIDSNTNMPNIRKFIDSIASLANLFQIESLGALHEDFDSLFFRHEQRKVKILTNYQMKGVQVTNPSKVRYEKVDAYTRKQIPIDDELTDIIMVKADPLEFMPEDRFERLKANVQDEIDSLDASIDDVKHNPDRVNEIIQDIENELIRKSNLYRLKKENLAQLKIEHTFYASQYAAAEFARGVDFSNPESILENLTDPSLDVVEEFMNKYNSDLVETASESSSSVPSFGVTWTKDSRLNNTLTLIEKRKQFREQYEKVKNLKAKSLTSITTVDPVTGDVVVVDTSENAPLIEVENATSGIFLTKDHPQYVQLMSIGAELKNMSSSIRDDYLSRTDIFRITPPNLANEERQKKIDEYISDIEIMEKTFKEEALVIFNEHFKGLHESVAVKQKQLKNFESKMVNTTGMVPPTDDENSTYMSYFHRSYPIKNKNHLYRNHLETYYKTAFTKDIWDIYKNDKVNLPNALSQQNYVYEFSYRRPPMSRDHFVSGDYVHLYRKGSAAGGGSSTSTFEFLGDGFIMDENLMNFNPGGYGNWFGVNFSDLIGTTTTIKALQKKVKSFENMFTPNDTMLKQLIRVLRDIRDKLLELIDIIDDLLNILLLSIEFEGTVWGKYCREEGIEGYDKLAADLTNTNGHSKPPKKGFRPSSLSSVQKYLGKIRKIDPEEANRIKLDIDQLYLQQQNHDERIKAINEKSQVDPLMPPDGQIRPGITNPYEGYGAREAVIEQSLKLKEAVAEQISDAMELAFFPIEIGSGLFANLDNAGIVETAQHEKNTKEDKVKYWTGKIYNEIAKVERKYSSEFGFSMVLLSYLPKGMHVYPVRWLADAWRLIDEDGNPITAPSLEQIDVGRASAMLPNNTLDTLKGALDKQAKNMNPSSQNIAKPEPIKIEWEPFRCVSDTNFENVIDKSTNPDYFEVISSSPHYEFRLKNPLLKNLHGVRSKNVLTLPKWSAGVAKTYTYRFEFTMSVIPHSSAAGLNIRELPKLNNINIHLGVFFKEKGYTFTKAIEVNAEHDTVFNFGNRKKKKFLSEIFEVKKSEDQQLLPYILIGYEPPQEFLTPQQQQIQKTLFAKPEVDMKSLIFQILDSEIYFYRIR